LVCILAINSGGLKTSIRSKKLMRMLTWMSIGLGTIGLYQFLFYGEIFLLSTLCLPLSLFASLSAMNKSFVLLLRILLYLLFGFALLKLFQ